jgi:hypothetical protein
MKGTPSERRLAENEVIFRQLNERAHNGLIKINELAHEDKQPEFIVDDDTPLYFYCECSSLSCIERVTITFREYGRIHQNGRDFVVVPGHEAATIERVIKKYSGYNVVRKSADLLE